MSASYLIFASTVLIKRLSPFPSSHLLSVWPWANHFSNSKSQFPHIDSFNTFFRVSEKIESENLSKTLSTVLGKKYNPTNRKQDKKNKVILLKRLFPLITSFEHLPMYLYCGFKHFTSRNSCNTLQQSGTISIQFYLWKTILNKEVKWCPQGQKPINGGTKIQTVLD